MKRLPVTDGMRAVAVIAVVLFHSFPLLVPGGFIGVDIFFVISGFVISLVYQDKLVAKSTSFVSFYVRRVRRLAPAYIAVVVVTTIACFLILLPHDLTNYAFSLALQAVYAQNIAFWIIGDYFEAGLAKPLLHTWSLAVEEQFYLVFPLLVLIARHRRSWGTAALIGLVVVSLAAGWFIGSISQKTTFYLLPTRMWEFGAGILATIPYRRGAGAGRLAAVLASTGFVLIVFSILAFDGSSHFPGPQSLAAVVGATMLLVGQDAETPVTALLCMRWAQWGGRISYSWYLWHWPPLSLWFLATGAAPGGPTALMLAAIGLAAGAVSYLAIEQRMARRRRDLKPIAAVAITAGFAAFAILCSVIVFRTDGFVRPYPPRAEVLMRAQLDVPPYRCPLARRLAMWREPICVLNDIGRRGGVVLIGDSHADRTKTVLVELADGAGVPLYLTKQNCRLTDYGARADCPHSALQALAEAIRHLGIQQAIAIAHWPERLSGEERSRLAGNIAALGIPIAIQLPTPAAATLDPATQLRLAENDARDIPLTRADVIRSTSDFRAAIYAMAKDRHDISVIDPLSILCPQVCLSEVKGVYLYRDSNHLTLQGVRLLTPLYRLAFERRPNSTTRDGRLKA